LSITVLSIDAAISKGTDECEQRFQALSILAIKFVIDGPDIARKPAILLLVSVE